MADEPTGEEQIEEPTSPREQAPTAAETPAVEATAEGEPTAEEPAVEEPTVEEPAAEEPAVEEPAAEEPAAPVAAEPVAEEPVAAEEPAVEEPVAEEPIVEEPTEQEPVAAVEEPVTEEPVAAEPVAAEAVAEPSAEEPAAEEPVATEPIVAEAVVEESSVEESIAGEPVAAEEPAAEKPVAAEPAAEEEDEDFDEEEEEPAPRVKPAVPGAHLEVDIVPEGVDPLARDTPADPYAIDEEEPEAAEKEAEEEVLAQPISTAAIDLAAGARYRATGKRKTAIARVILRPGTGAYLVNGRTLEEHFPRATLQRNIRQPLETVGYEERMDVVARLHGGGISAQAGALRHGVSRALLEADPNLRGELKRRGFLTRDSRAKERKKAGLKKARKRPQFSKR